jgi:glutathione S-transferase
MLRVDGELVMTPKLVSLSYSPFSERARWALDHHRVAYQLVDHVPVVGELRLRRLAKGKKGRVTAPLLITDDATLCDSWDIARYADVHGVSSKLLPDGRIAEIEAFNARANAAMTEGRSLLVRALLESPGALDESLPAFVPHWMRPLMRPGTRLATRWFGRKYECDLAGETTATERLQGELDALRAALATSSPYLLGSFSYADILMATMLQGVAPVRNEYIYLGPESRKAWHRSALANEYEDLLRWRDEIYARHRRPQ